jgi:hypothetical protein
MCASPAATASSISALAGRPWRVRSALIEASLKMKIGGPLFYSASSVVAAIDGLAVLLTAELDYFYLKGHARKDDSVCGPAPAQRHLR